MSTPVRLHLSRLYYLAEPQFPFLLNENNYGICLTRLSLRRNEAMNAKCFMLSKFLHSCELVNGKECLGYLVRTGTWQQILRAMKKREVRGRKVNKKNCPDWYFLANFEINNARSRTLSVFSSCTSLTF